MLKQFEIFINARWELDVRHGDGRIDTGAVASLGWLRSESDARALLQTKLDAGAFEGHNEWVFTDDDDDDFTPQGYALQTNNRDGAARMYRLIKVGQTREEMLEEQALIDNAEAEYFLSIVCGGYADDEDRASYPAEDSGV